MSWEKLSTHIARLTADGNPLSFWIRDDDLQQDNSKARELLKLSEKYSAPIAWAVVPGRMDESLKNLLIGHPLVTVVQHGYMHINHGKGTGCSGEFQFHRPLEIMKADALKGKQLLESFFGEQFFPVFVPPWNQISDEMILELPGLGYRGVSRFGPESKRFPIPIRNCDCDVIKWKPQPHFTGETKSLLSIIESIEQKNSIVGLLTHHNDHDPSTFEFLEKLFSFLAKNKCEWKSIAKVFS